MSNFLMGYQNRVDGSVLSGGPCAGGLGLAQLQNRQLGKVARFVDDDPVNTFLVIDMQAASIVRVFGYVGHNLSQNAEYRLRIGDDPTFATTAYDSGWIDVWPTVYEFGDIPWGAENWWEGKYSEEDIANLTWSIFHDLGTEYLNRYARLDLADANNPDGFIEAGRVFIGRGWQGSRNMQYGANLGWEDPSTVEGSATGGEFFDAKRPYRVARFVATLPEREGLAQAFEVQRRAGVTGEVVFMWDPADATHSIRRNFYGRNRQLSPVEFPFLSLTSAGFEVKEITP